MTTLVNRFHVSVVLACLAAAALSNLVVARLQAATANPRMLAAQQANDAEVLCVGSSHFQRAIDPRQYDQRVVNLNHPGLNYEFAEYVLRPRLRASLSIQTVVLEFGYTPLFRNTAESQSHAIWQLDPEPTILGIAPMALASQFVPMLRSPKPTPATMLQQFLLGSPANPKEDIVPGYEESQEVMLATGTERAVYHNTLYHTKNSARNTAAFWRIVAMCKAANVNIVLLALPYADGYEDAISPELVADLNGFRKEVDARGLTVVDCTVREWTDAEFRDGDHVNSRGAVEVTKLLCKQIPARESP